MRLFNTAIRDSRQRETREYGLASIVTALLLPAAAAVLLWMFPTGCDLRGDPAIYRWTCLLPGLLLSVPIAVALILPVVLFLNRRFAIRLPDGWLVTIVTVGLLTQLALSGGYLLGLDPAYRDLVMMELIFVPQPFVAGVLSGTVYCTTLSISADDARPG